MAGHGAIAWLDFRRDDLTRARDFIKAMQDEGVLDELGFLGLQGQFADVFYPATSTLMRSARYLYFVAAIYRDLERQGIPSNQVEPAARRKQDDLREVLSQNERTGVIGRDAKLGIKQLPSTVYWSGLRQLGMFTSPLSEAGYHARFDELRLRWRGYADDDKTLQSADAWDYWDPDLPPPRFFNADAGFRSSTDFRLTRREARDLQHRFESRFPASLLVHLMHAKRPEVPFPWAAPRPDAVLANYLRHAEALSLFARGTTLQYYALVLEARSAAKMPVADIPVASVFERWWSFARPTLLRWDPNALLALPGLPGAMRHGDRGDLAFIQRWLDRVGLSESAAQLLGDGAARQLVRRREIDVKPTKARLKHRKHLEQWHVAKISESAHQLDYRHRIGTSFVSEILAGLESGE